MIVTIEYSVVIDVPVEGMSVLQLEELQDSNNPDDRDRFEEIMDRTYATALEFVRNGLEADSEGNKGLLTVLDKR